MVKSAFFAENNGKIGLFWFSILPLFSENNGKIRDFFFAKALYYKDSCGVDVKKGKFISIFERYEKNAPPGTLTCKFLGQ